MTENTGQPKTITFDFFKAWLEGIEELQEENWSPDARQWKKIRDKIAQIDDAPKAPPMRPAPAPAYPQQPPVTPNYNFPEVPSRIPLPDESILRPSQEVQMPSSTLDKKGDNGLIEIKSTTGSSSYKTPLE